MKIIKITTDNQVTTLDFPKGNISQQNRELRAMIGADCGLYEHVLPKFLYTELKAGHQPTPRQGDAVSMLIDESGAIKELPDNPVGSYLYGCQEHGCHIYGNVLIIGEYLTTPDHELCFSGLSDSQYSFLLPQLQDLAKVYAGLADHMQREEALAW